MKSELVENSDVSDERISMRGPKEMCDLELYPASIICSFCIFVSLRRE